MEKQGKDNAQYLMGPCLPTNQKKIPVQGHHSKIEILECCLKNADKPPGGGGGRSPPPLGDHLHSLSNTREIQILSDGLGKGFFFDLLEGRAPLNNRHWLCLVLHVEGHTD